MSRSRSCDIRAVYAAPIASSASRPLLPSAAAMKTSFSSAMVRSVVAR